MENYLLETGSQLCEMRLIAEGAVKLWEEEAQPAVYQIQKAERREAVLALDTIISALYALRLRIQRLQADHHSEVIRRDEAAVKGGRETN